MTSKDDNPVLADFENPLSNVFLMTRSQKTEQYTEIVDAISFVLAEYSLNLIIADSKQYQNELWANVKSCIDASYYGIAVFEQIDKLDINPNVSLELGYMLAKGKKCLLLKEQRVKALQTDLVGHLYKTFDSYNIKETVILAVRNWLKDLGIIKGSDETMIAFVSKGGTCRCAMAKAITKKIIKKYKLNFKLRVESFAQDTPSLAFASNGARQSILSLFDEDLLSDHRPMRLTDSIKEEADLILVMENKLLEDVIGPTTCKKTQIFKKFFGLKGDIIDPWDPNEGKTEAQRYDECAKELKEVLEYDFENSIRSLRKLNDKFE